MQQFKRPPAVRYAVPSDRILPVAIACGIFALFVATLPIEHRFYPVPATVEFSQALLIGGSLLVAAFGLAEFNVTRRAGAGIIGVAFLFYFIDAVVSLGLLPTFLVPAHREEFASAPPWLYILRHAWFAACAIAYARLARTRDGAMYRCWPSVSSGSLIVWTTVFTIASCLVLAVLSPYLPSLAGPQALANFRYGAFPVVTALFTFALLAVLRIERRTRLDYWIMLAVWAFFVEFTGHAIDVDRLTVEFYLSRLLEIIGIFGILGLLVYYGFESYWAATVQADEIGHRRLDQQQRFAATVNGAAIAIAHLNAEGRILFANDQLVRLAGRPLPALSEETLWTLLREPARSLCELQDTLAFEARLERSDNAESFVAVTIALAPSGAGSADYWIAILNDVTARKQAERAMVTMNDIKSAFIGTITREIRTPLSGIVGVTELLTRTALSEKQRRFVETMDASAHTLLRLINDVLDFSNIDKARVELDHALFDLVRHVEMVVEAFSATAAAKCVELNARFAPEAVGAFYGDPVRLRQILDNLVNNALKFTERGSVTISVDGAEVPDDTRTFVTISVTDTGIGIPEEEQARIFEAFAQAEGATRRYGGSGLGLAIVRKLVELMEGWMTLTSREGGGSTFAFTIPLEHEDEERRLDATATSLRGMRSIAVSDDETLRQDVLGSMISWGMLVGGFAAAGDVHRALERQANDKMIECAVIDGDFAELDQLVRSFEGDGRFEDMAYVFLGTLRDDVAKQIPLWRRRLIAKPVRTSSLYDAIAGLCVKEEGAAVGSRLALPPLRSERILVAEDNETNRMLAMAQLEQLGFAADFVEDGSGAIAAAKTGLYALILMDGQMPRTDGFEATRSIRDWERDRETHVPIIAMTASTSAGYRDRCFAAGMDDYLAKPVLLSSLQATLDKWLPRPDAEQEHAPAQPPPTFERLRAIFHADESAIQRVLNSALRSFDDGLEQLGDAVDSAAWAQAAKAAHRIAGVALDVDASLIVDLCRQIEADAEKCPDREAMRATVDRIEDAIEDFRLAAAAARATA